MEDGVNVDDNNTLKMGATSNINASRLATLQEKKKNIEETLKKRVEELKELCIEEFNLTGSFPPETPLEPGEPFPTTKKTVGAAYEFSENLIKNADNDELIANLELQIQIHCSCAEAALKLANQPNSSKTVRRQHRSEYQKQKQLCTTKREQLHQIQQKLDEQQIKQKKKSRTPQQDDNISVNTTVSINNDPFAKSTLRQSLRSVKQEITNDGSVDLRYQPSIVRNIYRSSDIRYLEENRIDESLTSSFYRLSIDGYTNYMERRENLNMRSPTMMYNTQNPVPYNLPFNSLSHQHMQHSPNYQQHSPQLSQNSPQLSQHHQNNHILHQRPSQLYNYSNQYPHDYKYNINQNKSNPQLHRQSSPNLNNNNTQKMYHSTLPLTQPSYRQYQSVVDNCYRNPHQIQPHQQYEQNVMTSGLGGCWKSNENGEMVWCNSNTLDANWNRDKRFGSLDRRKNRRLHKRISPTVDSKSATLSTIPSYSDHVRTASVKSSHIIARRQDNRQLVRTQSLGSVGAQTTVDSVWPSDDNSSCNSDNHSINDINHGCTRKPKEKEWLETSLDGPVSPTTSVMSYPHSALPSPHSTMPSPQTLPSPSIPNHPSPSVSTVLAPEEKYVQHIPPPLTPKPILEIPAESNPSPRLPESNMEMFNNNVPQNCTVLQHGYEETKPFEMSDFYKYSTKFNKSPIKENSSPVRLRDQEIYSQKKLVHHFEDHRHQPELPLKSPPYRMSNISIGSPDTSSGTINNSLDLSHIGVSENFSSEMNAWYKDHEQQIENNGSTSKSRSTATLV